MNQVMNGVQDDTQGGAIIFITDGQQQCQGGPDSTDIDDEALIDRIIRTKIRIITVAFGLVRHCLNNYHFRCQKIYFYFFQKRF